MFTRKKAHIGSKGSNTPTIFKSKNRGNLFIQPKIKEAQTSDINEGDEKQAQSQNNKKVAASKPKLDIKGNSYTDTATESRKNVKFQVSNVPSGESVEDYAIVNWLKGYSKKGNGGYFKVKMYGSWVDYNFPKYQVDSVDTDPIYWSTTSNRWNFDKEGSDGFSATDSPGPALTTEKGAFYNIKFKTQLYRMSDLPLATSGKLSGSESKAIRTKWWRYRVKVNSRGEFRH